MSVLYITAPDEQTGVIAAITDDPCPCGWPETIVHVHPDGRMMRGCASCEIERRECDTGTLMDPCRGCPGCRAGAAVDIGEEI